MIAVGQVRSIGAEMKRHPGDRSVLPILAALQGR
jgi:hypothetical protein